MSLLSFTAAEYARQFQRLLPRGRIWHRGVGRVQDADIEVLMPTWVRLGVRTQRSDRRDLSVLDRRASGRMGSDARPPRSVHGPARHDPRATTCGLREIRVARRSECRLFRGRGRGARLADPNRAVQAIHRRRLRGAAFVWRGLGPCLADHFGPDRHRVFLGRYLGCRRAIAQLGQRSSSSAPCRRSSRPTRC